MNDNEMDEEFIENNNINDEIVDQDIRKDGSPTKEFIQSTLKDKLLEIISSKDVEILQSYLSDENDQLEKKLILDQSFKEVLQKLISTDPQGISYRSFLDFIVDCVHKNIISQSLLFVIITDLFDTINLDVCSEIFSYVEEKIDIWKSEIMHKTCKNYFLRMCNDLLKRLSTMKHTIFCGRIQLFLARLFSIEEKSALNLMSNFNVENVTVYNNSDKPINTNSIDEDGNETIPVDFNLYKKFWRLQNFFSKPTDCYNANSWKSFKESSEEVLNCFDSFKLADEVFWNDKASKKDGEESEQSESNSAKYLTSEKLFNLQLTDGNFRRHVLVQFLILFQYLTAEVKFKVASQVLKEDQEEWVKNAKETVFKLLLETPPDAAKFVQTIDFLLNSEDKWNVWKNNGCPSYIKEEAKVDAPVTTRKRKTSICSDIRNGSKVKNLGNPNVSKVWSAEPHIKDDPFPTLDSFFHDAIEELDPASGMEEQYLMIHNDTFAWKSWRVLSRLSPYFYGCMKKCSQVNLREVVNKMTETIKPPTSNLEAKKDSSTEDQVIDQTD